MIPREESLVIVKKGTDLDKVNFEEGAIILIDKPLKWTSFDVVNKIRWPLRHKYGKKKFKVGHNGTLDPLATGLLMIFTGRYTKRIPQEENHDKRYIGQVKLGATTDTLDREMEEKDLQDISNITLDQIRAKAQTFIGEIEQEIPIYSATKVNGQAMYKLARKNKEFVRKTKKVTFHEVEINGYEEPLVDFDILCGKGTYIRAFARDLGTSLDTSAYLYGLRRTEIAQYSVDDALDVNILSNLLKENS